MTHRPGFVDRNLNQRDRLQPNGFIEQHFAAFEHRDPGSASGV
jgi:hypothetical protein